MTTDQYDLDFFTDPALIDDPFPFLEGLRGRCPVTPMSHHGVVAVTGYDLAAEIWRDNATYSSINTVTGPFPGLPFTAEGDDIAAEIEANRSAMPMHEYLVTKDQPDHTALRGLLMRLLTPSRLKENEDFIHRLAREQVAAVLELGSFEMHKRFASPFALLVIADLLGIPEADHRTFAGRLGQQLPGPAVGEIDTEQAMDPLAFLNDYFTTYIEDRRRNPQSDVLTQLALATYPDGSTPPVIEVVRTATFLFAAGQDTVARLMTASLQIIAEDPALQARLRAEPDRIPDLLEEVLRLEGPVKSIARMARRSTTLGDMDIPAGTCVVIFPHAVNRDPERYENPDELDLDRSNSRTHVAFGRGIHSCPGGSLARVEARIALEQLLAATTDISIDAEHHGPADARRYEYEPTYILRGLKALHVTATTAPVQP
jgi:cytochrome P450